MHAYIYSYMYTSVWMDELKFSILIKGSIYRQSITVTVNSIGDSDVIRVFFKGHEQ